MANDPPPENPYVDIKPVIQSLDPKELGNQIVNSAQEGIVILDRDLRYVVWNPFMESISGKTQSEVQGRRPWEVFPFLVEQGIERHMREALAGATITALDSFVPGQNIWVSARMGPIRGKHGTIHGVLVTLREITERKKAEAELKFAETRFRALIEHSQEAILLLDANAKKLYASPAIAQITGYSAEEYMAMESFKHLHADDIDRTRKMFQEVLKQPGKVVHIETRLRRKDGSYCWLEANTSNLLDVPGIHAVVVNMRDISERKRAEEEHKRLEAQIQHAQRLESLGILAGGIAHDFNNLLVGILGNADLALLDLAPQAPARLRIESIRAAGIRASELTRQMLAYSGKGKFVVETLRLNEVIEEMGHLLLASISKKATLKYDLSPETPPIEADGAQIRQVVMNLIINASEALGERSGVITLTTGFMDVDAAYNADLAMNADLAEGRYAYLEVSDNGCGMDAQTQAKIFDPFFSTKFTGRGLGLSAVLGILRGHNGAIKVYSEPGKGTSFKLFFPSSVNAAARAEKPAKAPPQDFRGSGLILVVDDEEILRQVIKAGLEKFGYEVIAAADGIEALELFRARANDVAAVVLDMTMPRMSGEETFRELRRIKPNVRVLLSSGYNEQDATNRFAGKGLAGFLQKPFQINVLLAKVREIAAS